MAISRSGVQDRRGFEGPIKLSVVAAVLGLLMIIMRYWFSGLAVMLLGACAFICLEVVSAPPVNGPRNFSIFSRQAAGRKPVLVCLGDSLTHGTLSASFTPLLPAKLSEALGMPPPAPGRIFSDPLWVVNCGQNGITTHTILHERLSAALGCYPDYILVWIGTNDVLCMYSKSWRRLYMRVNELPQEPTMEVFERNLTGILNFIRQSSPKVQVGLATLPPLGEDLKSPANQLIRKANEIIERIGKEQGELCFVINVYSNMEAIIEKKRGKIKAGVSPDSAFYVAQILNPLYHLTPGLFSWNALSKFFNHAVLTDGIHLNERGIDEVGNLIVDWLMKTNIAKAIAVKNA